MVVPGVEIASNVNQAAAVLQVGGLVLVATAMVCAIGGALLADDEGRGSRLFGYSAAIGGAGLMAVLSSTWLTGDGSLFMTPWMYALIAFVVAFTYATNLIRRNTRQPTPQRHVARPSVPLRPPDRAPLRRRTAAR